MSAQELWASTGQPGWKCYENVCKVQSVYIRFPGSTLSGVKSDRPKAGGIPCAFLKELWNSTRCFFHPEKREKHFFGHNWFQHHEFCGTCEGAPPAFLRVLRKARCPCHTWAKGPVWRLRLGSVLTSDVIRNVNNHVAEPLKVLFDHSFAQFGPKSGSSYFWFYTSWN